MKNLLNNLMVIAILFSLASCTNEIMVTEDPAAFNEELLITPCAGENPKARISNNGTVATDFEIFDENGVLVGSAYNVLPGVVSSWKSFSPGIIQFKVSTSVSFKAVVVDMGNCMGYDVAIDANNQLDTDLPINF